MQPAGGTSGDYRGGAANNSGSNNTGNDNSGNNNTGNSIPATGNFIPNGTVEVPGIGVLPASQQPSGLVYVLFNGNWILLAALQEYYNQVVFPLLNQQQGGGNTFGGWLNDNKDDLLILLENILNGTTQNAGDFLLDLGTLLPRGQQQFRLQ